MHRESVIFVIQDDSNQLLGFAQLYPSFSSVSMERSWILNDLFVQPEYRGKRLAQQLLAGVKQYAQLTKSKGISLATGIDNEIAQRIYEQQGFVREDAFYHYYLKLS